MGEQTYQQGAWTAIHLSTFKAQQATNEKRQQCKCSGCKIQGAQLRFVKIDSSWYGVAACPQCYPYATAHVGILKLNYPPRAKASKKDNRQYKLPL